MKGAKAFFSFQRFALIYTAVITTYLLVRAFFNEFLADETASYWYYAYSGDFCGKNIVLDAANHPLNSLLSRFSYLVFGDIRGLIRIWSVLSYLLYAYFSFKICQQYKRKSLQYLGFVTLNAIPYMLEYFAYTRGYGLSMGFFMGGLYFLCQFVKTPSWKYLGCSYLFGLLGYSANLTLLNFLLLMMGAAVFFQWILRATISMRLHLQFVLLHLLLCAGIVPFVQFSFRLKEAGALYYSTLDGLWDMTGRTLTEYTLFYHEPWLMYIFLAFMAVVVFMLVKRVVSFGFIPVFRSNYAITAFLFFGNLALAVFLAEVMHINYPSDRTGMYFIPLFLILLFHVMEKVKFSEWILLFFPASLVTHLSVHTSIFSPDDRMTNSFFDQVYRHVKPENTIVIYKTMFSNWLYMNSHKAIKAGLGIPNMEQTKYADIFLTKEDRQQDTSFRNPNLHLYHLIARDKDAHSLAYKRNKPALRTQVFQKDISSVASTNETFEFVNDSNFRIFTSSKNLLVAVQGQLKLPKFNKLHLVLTTSEQNDQLVRYNTYPIELAYQSQAVDETFHVNYLLENIDSNEIKMKLYLWSLKVGELYQLKNVKITIFELN